MNKQMYVEHATNYCDKCGEMSLQIEMVYTPKEDGKGYWLDEHGICDNCGFEFFEESEE